MKHPIATLASLLVAASALHAQAEDAIEAPDTTRFSAVIAMRLGSISGQLLDQEGSAYDGIGLRVVNQVNHDTSSIDPIGASIGLDACVMYHISPRIQVGFALVTQSTDVKHSQGTSSELSANLLEEQALMGRLRVRAFSYSHFRFGLEASVGRSSGTLHRFAIAQKNIESIKAGILGSTDSSNNKPVSAVNIGNYIGLGNKDLAVSGVRYEAMLMVARPLSNHLGLEARLGFHHTSLSPDDTDPLTSYAKQIHQPVYPSSVTSIGIDCTLGLLASF